MALPGAAPPKPIPIKERAALVFVERARLDVKDGAFVAIQADGTRVHLPVGGVACLMLEPGARISHAAVSLCRRRFASLHGRRKESSICLSSVPCASPVVTASGEPVC